MIPETIDTLTAGAHGVPDTLAATSGGEGKDIFGELLHHVQDAHEVDTPFGVWHLPHIPEFHIAGLTIDRSITKHVLFMWIAALLLCGIAAVIARRSRRSIVPHGLRNLFEVLIVFVRDEIVIPNMGSGGTRYLPYLLTTFFFILCMNLLGLIPYGASATGNVNVTAGLAIIAFVMIQASAIRAQGLRAYLAHLTGGVHWLLWPIMIPIEVLGLFTKAFALCIRLFANMMGGHTVLVIFIGLIFVFRSYLIALGPVGFSVGLFFLELFVAVLQAYIFTMLTSLFMGLGMQPGGHEESGGDHGGS